jgi:hypothetical protein
MFKAQLRIFSAEASGEGLKIPIADMEALFELSCATPTTLYATLGAKGVSQSAPSHLLAKLLPKPTRSLAQKNLGSSQVMEEPVRIPDEPELA